MTLIIGFTNIIVIKKKVILSLKSKHSFPKELYDELDVLHNVSTQKESTKKRNINV